MVTFIRSQGADYTICCLLYYRFFNNYYKMIAIDLSKEQAFDADPKAIQEISFVANLDRERNITMFFIIEELKEKHFRFFTRNCGNVVNLFYFNIISI